MTPYRKGKQSGDARTFPFAIAAKPAKPADGNIVGTLFNDDDGDGSIDATDKPTGVRPVELQGDGHQVGTTSAADGTYAFKGLAAGTYRIRRSAFPKGYRCSNQGADAAGWLTVQLEPGQTAVVNIGTTAAEATKPTPVPSLPERKQLVMAAVEMVSLDPALPVTSPLWDGTRSAARVAIDAGITGMREWFTLGTNKKDSWWNRIRAWIKAGVTDLYPVLNYGGAKLPTPEQMAKLVQQWVDSVPADIKPHIRFVSVGNEPGVGEYWRERGTNKDGTAEDAIRTFVTLFLNPAYDVLHAAGYTVAAAGLNGSFPSHYKIIRQEGGKHDVIDIHPYCKTPEELAGKMDALDAENVDPTLPYAFSEWNVFLGKLYRQWLADGMDPAEAAAKVIACQNAQHEHVEGRARLPIVAAYFVAIVDGKWTTGLFGMIDVADDGNSGRTTPFHDGYLAKQAA